jgi:hypothetical protein
MHTIHKKEHDLIRTAETAEEIFERTKAREIQISRLLVFYISSGLLLMLLPGAFLGVWNLVAISSRRAAKISHPHGFRRTGHAQVLGWIGTFILGHRLLFHSQTTRRDETLSRLVSVACGNRMDEWCAAAMVRQCVLVALANSVASVCRIRACSLPHVCQCCLATQGSR